VAWAPLDLTSPRVPLVSDRWIYGHERWGIQNHPPRGFPHVKFSNIQEMQRINETATLGGTYTAPKTTGEEDGSPSPKGIRSFELEANGKNSSEQNIARDV
jgi:hypothetical protein